MEKRKGSNNEQKSKKGQTMTKLRNSLTARESVPIGDINKLPSMTDPDQTISIKDLIQRHVDGVPLGTREYEPVYSEEDLPDFESMDIEELAQWRHHLSEERFRLEDALRKAETAQRAIPPNGSEADTDEGGTRQVPPTQQSSPNPPKPPAGGDPS